MGFSSGVLILKFVPGHLCITIKILVIFAVSVGKNRNNVSLHFKIRVSGRIDGHIRNTADRSSFFSFRFLGAKIGSLKGALENITISRIMQYLTLKLVGHI
jgi:hypothetical protein